MSSISEQKRRDEPQSYFIYEQLGERVVGPDTLIDNAMDLWFQCAFDYDVAELWDVAQELLDSNRSSPEVSWPEHLRVSIIMGSTVPRAWKDASSFPFKGLLISAIYVKEAYRALRSPMPDRAWHLIALAYYHLGLNTTESELMAQARKRAEKNAAITEEARALVVAAVDWVAKNRNPRSIAEAQELVLGRLVEKEQSIEEFLLLYADKTNIDKSLSMSQRRSEALDRIGDRMREWALPRSPFPEISRRFAQFNQRKATEGTPSPTTESLQHDDSDKRMHVSGLALEIVSVRGDGLVQTTRISKADLGEFP